MLTGQEIINANVLTNHAGSSVRDASYDIRIGTIYPPQGILSTLKKKFRMKPDEVVEYELPPQGVALIFSEEVINMPMNYCGFAEPKTAMCSNGILILNTGIVDPGFSGPLSGTAINFSKNTIKLSKTEIFLRLVVHPIPSAPAGPAPNLATPAAIETYKNSKKLSAKNMPPVFLDVPATAKQVSRNILTTERAWLIGILGVVGLPIATLGIYIACLQFQLALDVGQPTLIPDKSQKVDVRFTGTTDHEETSKRLKDLEKRNEALEKALQKQSEQVSDLIRIIGKQQK